MAIIKAEVAMAVVVTFIDHVVMEEAITEAITITNTINITCIMMELSWNNMVHLVVFVKDSVTLLNIVLRENMCMILVPIIVLYLCRTLVSSFTTNLNSTKLHLQCVAPRSQYSDPTPEAVTLQ